jgi:PTH1 family peptidyl-tRNA hydrolase
VWLLVGLGNPGPRYRRTRHNIGFDVVEVIGERWGIDPGARSQLDALVGDGLVGAERCLLVRPQSYMNRSGLPVSSLAQLYGVAPEKVLVVHDDLDLPFPSLRCKRKGGHGGHNGLRDILRLMGGDFPRLRVGIGRPAEGQTVTEHVLGGWSEAEQEHKDKLTALAADAVEAILADGLTAAMNRFNVRPSAPVSPAQEPPTTEPTPGPPRAPGGD